jgi:hypothetical protein
MFLIIPFGNIITSYFISPYDVSFSTFLYSLFVLPSNRGILIEFILPNLIAAYATYSVKKWSYSVLGLYVLWVAGHGIYKMIRYYNDINMMQTFFIFMLPAAFATIVALYFFIPSVKTTYFDKRIRWWEAKPRYKTNIDAKVELEDQNSVEVTVKNLSEGGAFVETKSDLELDTYIKIQFEVNKVQIDTRAKIVFKRSGDMIGHGLQFDPADKTNHKKMKMIIKYFKTTKTPLCRPIPMWDEDLKKWLRTLLKTGKGITPEIPQKYQTKNNEL